MPENTEFSLSTITIVISVAAFVMPAVTTLISNIHQLIMKKIEQKQAKFERTELYKQKVFEEYLRSVGEYIGSDGSNKYFAQYTKAYLTALLYAPNDICETMGAIHKLLDEANFKKATSSIESLIEQVSSRLLK